MDNRDRVDTSNEIEDRKETGVHEAIILGILRGLAIFAAIIFLIDKLNPNITLGAINGFEIIVWENTGIMLDFVDDYTNNGGNVLQPEQFEPEYKIEISGFNE